MNSEPAPAKKKRRTRKIVLWVFAIFLILFITAIVIVYNRLGHILANALTKSFNTSIISDVYDLKFEKLSISLLGGDVSVHNVDFRHREKSLQDYPYINSSLQLHAKTMVLKNVDLITLLKSNILKVDKIEILEPGIDFYIEDKIPVFFPIKDTGISSRQSKKNSKRYIDAFVLKEFNLINASMHTTNLARERDFTIKDLSLSLADVMINQEPGKDEISYKHIKLSIGEFAGNLRKKSIKSVNFKDFEIRIDSFSTIQTKDTSTWHFGDFATQVKGLDIQTADSLFHLTMQSFALSYKDKSIQLDEMSFQPNVSNARVQADYRYQHTQFSGTIGSFNLQGVNFDSLIYKGKIFIDKVILDKASFSIYKDKTKPVDKNNYPKYLGQAITSIKPALFVKQLQATNVNLVNKERNEDGSYATANVNRASIEVKNITNLTNAETLTIKANAYIENKAHFNLGLNFSYKEPRFDFNGNFQKFNLPDLNALIEAYTPASIHKGVADKVSFSGNANRTNSTGTLIFLYHDLDIDVELEGEAKWKSDVLAFGANTILPSANPASADLPTRVVSFQVERDLNKAFVNLIIKSILKGLKETMVMSKENKKSYKAEKKEMKKKAREEKKRNKKENN